MAELLLNAFMRTGITHGMLWLYRMFPPDLTVRRVFQNFLNFYGHRDIPMNDVRFLVENDYDFLLTTMAWCLTCDWEFDFVSSQHRYAIRTGEDKDIDVFWPLDQALKPTVPQLLKGIEARKLEKFEGSASSAACSSSPTESNESESLTSDNQPEAS
jgi:hypothetical protein